MSVAAALLALVGALASTPLSAERVAGEVRYRASDQRSSWVGTAPLVVERFEGDLGDLTSVELEASVRVADLRTGNALRDFEARRSVFDAGAHPEVRFVLRRIEPVDGDPEGHEHALRLTGDLTLRGTTREVVAVARLDLDDAHASVTATLELSLAAFEVDPPRLFTWVVDDRVLVEVDATWPLDRGSTATTPRRAPRAPAAGAMPPAGSAARR